MKVYLASPLFNDEETENHNKVLEVLKSKNLSVYAPMLNQYNQADFSKPEWANKTFLKDITEIQKCDIVVMIFYGLYSDSGTAWECGYAYGLGKPVICLHLHSGKSNVMINCSSHASFRSIEELKDYDFNSLNKVNWYNFDVKFGVDK